MLDQKCNRLYRHHLDAWPRNPTNNLTFKNCVFEKANVVKIVINKNNSIVDTELLDVAALWSSDTGIAGNVIIVGVDNSSSSHADNCQNKFLILSERSSFWS